MSEAREHILGTIRRNLKRGPLQGKAGADLETRLAHPPDHPIPARAQLPHAEQVALFIQMATEASASVERLAGLAQVPAAVASFIAAHELPAEIVVTPDQTLTALSWSDTDPELSIQSRKAEDGDRVTVSLAFAGMAETGTLMMLSGPHSPITLNFLPDAHIVVLPVERIVGPYEDAWSLLRERGTGMPRAVNWITGPSRSADIEQQLQMGAHGPIRLHILLIEA